MVDVVTDVTVIADAALPASSGRGERDGEAPSGALPTDDDAGDFGGTGVVFPPVELSDSSWWSALPAVAEEDEDEEEAGPEVAVAEDGCMDEAGEEEELSSSASVFSVCSAEESCIPWSPFVI